MISVVEKCAILLQHDYVVGARNPRLNTDHPGDHMVAEPFSECELPTRDGRVGPWCIVGDSLVDLVDEAYEYLQGNME